MKWSIRAVSADELNFRFSTSLLDLLPLPSLLSAQQQIDLSY